ncbi:membrane protein [Aliivibrio wodanis]|uniref:Membrane protein n=2 Tax=Aliivibrio wodanis TaxID=80852 RepID=A0A090I7G9_9GAMM|nr:membrane protein [Aliivibrio wodanis]
MMGSKEKIDQLKEQLYQAKIIYSWEDIGGGLKDKLVVWGVATVIGWLLPLFLICVESIPLWSNEFWFFTGCAIAGMLVVRYLFFPDKHFCYHLTPMGVHYTEQDMIPEVAYKIARGFAWVGIVVCIIVAFMFGSLAFVGAGAFALMSFGMTNFQSTIQEHEVFFSDRPILFNPVNDTMFRVDSNTAPDYCCRRDFYVPSLEQKKQIITAIQNSQKNIEYVELAKLNDMFKHPIFIQD